MLNGWYKSLFFAKVGLKLYWTRSSGGRTDNWAGPGLWRPSLPSRAHILVSGVPPRLTFTSVHTTGCGQLSVCLFNVRLESKVCHSVPHPLGISKWPKTFCIIWHSLPTVATIQASTSHVYFQTNLFRGHVDQLLLFSYHIPQIKLNFIASPQLYTALNS